MYNLTWKINNYDFEDGLYYGRGTGPGDIDSRQPIAMIGTDNNNTYAHLQMSPEFGIHVHEFDPFTYEVVGDDLPRLRAPGGGFFGEHLPGIKEFTVKLSADFIPSLQQTLDGGPFPVTTYMEKVREMNIWFHVGRTGRLIWSTSALGGTGNEHYFIEARVVGVEYGTMPSHIENQLQMEITFRAVDPFIYEAGLHGVPQALPMFKNVGRLNGPSYQLDLRHKIPGTFVYPKIVLRTPKVDELVYTYGDNIGEPVKFDWTSYDSGGGTTVHTNEPLDQAEYLNTTHTLSSSLWDTEFTLSNITPGDYYFDPESWSMEASPHDPTGNVDHPFIFLNQPHNRFGISGYENQLLSYSHNAPTVEAVYSSTGQREAVNWDYDIIVKNTDVTDLPNGTTWISHNRVDSFWTQAMTMLLAGYEYDQLPEQIIGLTIRNTLFEPSMMILWRNRFL